VRAHTARGVFDGVGAVVALPLGVLQAGAVRFEPALPERKVRALGGLAMGTLDKCVLVFERAFWPEEAHFLGYLSPTRGEFPVFMNLRRLTGATALMAFCAGDFARALEDDGDDAARERCLAALRRMFGRRVSRVTGFVRSRWHRDPWALGSYSHVPPGGADEAYDLLAEPEGALRFAGEHTIRACPATVHGALLSGLREADRLATSLGR
jgi:monoamine oxidase